MTYLVSERQTLIGEIMQLTKALEENPAKIAKRREMIDAIDLVLAHHPLRIDASHVPGVKRREASALPYGKLTELVLRVFREAAPDAKINTFTIASEVRRHAALQLERREFNGFHKRVLKTLNYLQKRGALERVGGEAASANDEAYWRVRNG